MRERQETREAKPGLSDDDKIRLQLYVDVHFFLGKLHELGAIDQVISNLSPQTSGFEQFCLLILSQGVLRLNSY